MKMNKSDCPICIRKYPGPITHNPVRDLWIAYLAEYFKENHLGCVHNTNELELIRKTYGYFKHSRTELGQLYHTVRKILDA